MTQIKYPEFFNRAPVLWVQDRLAGLLGAAEHGIMEYRYADAVCSCGHSCPIVAGAYLMVLKGLQALYGTELSQCGEIEVAMQGTRGGGMVGVTAAIAQLLTGVAPEAGLSDIDPHGQFFRRNLLSFDAGTDAVLVPRRKDNGKTAAVSLSIGMYPFVPEMHELMPEAVGGAAAPEEFKRSGEPRQARAKVFLLDLADNPQFMDVRAA